MTILAHGVPGMKLVGKLVTMGVSAKQAAGPKHDEASVQKYERRDCIYMKFCNRQN